MATYCAKATSEAPKRINLGMASTPIYGWASRSGLPKRGKDWRRPVARFTTDHGPKLIKRQA